MLCNMLLVISQQFAILLLLLVQQYDCIPLDELLPYGVDNGDMSLAMGSTTTASVQLPLSFVFYGQKYQQMHVSVCNAHIT